MSRANEAPSSHASELAPPASPSNGTERAALARAALRPWVAAGVLCLAVQAADRSVPLHAPEATPWRWIRTASRHPVRLGLAFGCLLLACRGTRYLPTRQSNS